MPELPDILLYLHALQPRIAGRTLRKMRIISPFVLRTFEPPIEKAEKKTVIDIERLGKRIVFSLEDDLFLVIHLMIAGRFRWSDKSQDKPPGRITLASFLFDNGTLHLVEPSQKKRASIHLINGHHALGAMSRHGLDVLSAPLEEFAAVLTRENHTLKRALTDPTLFDGIGNAYSDEILHTARLSPLTLTRRLTEEQITALHGATQTTLRFWIARLQKQFAKKFPGAGDVTAFRHEFAVHGKFDQPCPLCGTRIQRIRYAENETNYCPRCQTGGRILADRSLSRLLKSDWIDNIDELEAR